MRMMRMMKQKRLKINLLSDLCVSDGGVYNSSLDTDVCYDVYGFPYIPGKRIKGCLRECAQELNDWDKKINIDKLFGTKNERKNRANVRIGDAYLSDYSRMRDEVMANDEVSLFHSQNVLNHFTYIRTQTAINSETGVADDTSVRTMRVVKKSLVFYADVELADDCEEELKMCASVLSHMGIARTRGLGEVKVSLEDVSLKNSGDYSCSDVTSLDYVITLLEPMVCKSVAGGESKSQDYIEGNKILGMVAQRLREQKSQFNYVDFMSKGELICSNAYIAKSDQRCTEVPANYFSIKNDSSTYVIKVDQKELAANNAKVNEELINELEGKQLNSMKHCYVLGQEPLARVSVAMEERYHHRRSEDKSLGRAAVDGTGDSGLYQISSISAGQEFRGFIQGSTEQIASIYAALKSQEIHFMGYGNSAEYGRVRIEVAPSALDATEEAKVQAEAILVKLEAPTIVYNEKAFYSTQEKDLREEIVAALDIKPEQIDEDGINRYINYQTLGGYNVTWNKRKPTIEAFDKGTVLYYPLKEKLELSLPKRAFIGERINEGYGEISVEVVPVKGNCRTGELRKSVSKNDRSNFQIKAGTFAEKLCLDLLRDFIKSKAVGDVTLKGEKYKPVVSNLILMCDSEKNLDQVKASVKDRYEKNSDNKQEKKKLADRILGEVEEGIKNIIPSFNETYGIEAFNPDQTDYEMDYLEAYLQQLKYSLRVVENAQGKEVENGNAK